jgi:hypothetical protein
LVHYGSFTAILLFTASIINQKNHSMRKEIVGKRRSAEEDVTHFSLMPSKSGMPLFAPWRPFILNKGTAPIPSIKHSFVLPFTIP